MNTPSSPSSDHPAEPAVQPGPMSLALQIRQILVPLDFSPHGQKSLRYAAAFARQFQARLILLHVTEPVDYPADFGYAPVPQHAIEENFQKDARERLETIAQEAAAAGLPTEVVLRIGRPYHEITSVAREYHVDLIIVTTHGYTGLTHVLLGSTAERVVRHAPCPVLVVRDQAHDFVTAAPTQPGPGADAG